MPPRTAALPNKLGGAISANVCLPDVARPFARCAFQGQAGTPAQRVNCESVAKIKINLQTHRV